MTGYRIFIGSRWRYLTAPLREILASLPANVGDAFHNPRRCRYSAKKGFLSLTRRPWRIEFIRLGDAGHQVSDGDIPELQCSRIDGGVGSHSNEELRHVVGDLLNERDAGRG